MFLRNIRKHTRTTKSNSQRGTKRSSGSIDMGEVSTTTTTIAPIAMVETNTADTTHKIGASSNGVRLIDTDMARPINTGKQQESSHRRAKGSRQAKGPSLPPESQPQAQVPAKPFHRSDRAVRRKFSQKEVPLSNNESLSINLASTEKPASEQRRRKRKVVSEKAQTVVSTNEDVMLTQRVYTKRTPTRNHTAKLLASAADSSSSAVTKLEGGTVEVDLEPFEILPPEAPPKPDAGVKGIWTYDEETRVLLADFREVSHISTKDKEHLLRMMERDDISVVSWGLVEPIKVSDSLLGFIEKEMHKKSPYHKFRRFDRVTEKNGESYYKEVGFHSMHFGDFREYFKLRMQSPLETFVFIDQLTKKVVSLDRVGDVALYLIDVEMEKHVSKLDSNYKKAFKIREIIPGGSFCMMSALPESARPFMGPNLYLTPGGFTSFHQDGHGTVDSGHTCMSGFNEVVMLRRLPEKHKLHAMSYLHRQGQHAMYHLPHEARKTDRQAWPTNDTVEEWTHMNYCPSVFILRPGQHLHINKGRLHCFRKLTQDRLGEADCHAGLRVKLVEELNSTPTFDGLWGYACLSIAFDWMYLGFTESGIEEEVRACLECADLCKHQKPAPLKYLAIPETALVRIASTLDEPIEPFADVLQSTDAMLPDTLDVCKGILSAFASVVAREIAHSKIDISHRASKPDHPAVPGVRHTDPFGSAYLCKICHAELANTYYQCVGCKELLNKNMFICLSCFEGQTFHCRVRMHTVNNKWFSDVNHIGIKVNRLKPSECGCHQGPCRKCQYCKSCSCRCHLELQQNQRFFSVKQLEDDLNRIRRLAAVPEPDESVHTTFGNASYFSGLYVEDV